MTRRQHPRPSRQALEAATAWQAPHGPRIEWSPFEVVEYDSFGGEILRLRINDAGEIGRHLPHCGGYLKVLGDDFQPLRSESLTCEADARELLDRVRALAGGEI